MLPPKELGIKGEEIAAGYLKKEGYKILARNWFYDHKEIDIIARLGDEIVIVEVKTREGDYFEEPWEAVSTQKIRNLVEVADAWLNERQIDLETRFDVISIVFTDDVKYELTHFPGAFIPPVN
ncbi:MAG TPA: YraN family protein [Prolixibacteraceae bacterium]|nr:YraN family protein [Prolixibacteraceae bacterium]